MKYLFDCITDFIFVKTNVEKSDIILVPGSSQPQLMEKAAELYKKGLAPYILPSGSYNYKIPEYERNGSFKKVVGIRAGVPENAILKENKAKNTFENAQFSLNVLDKNNLHIKKAILVCKSYHSRRALLTYQSVFPLSVEFFVCPVRDKSGLTKDNWFLDSKYISVVMGEVQKIGKYFEDKIYN